MMMLIPPERADEESDILDRIRRGESVKHFETVRMRKGGTRVDISAAISPIQNARGVIVGASKIARDITDRKAAEQDWRGKRRNSHGRPRNWCVPRRALETQTLMLQSVLDSIGEGLVAADETGKFILWNPAATRIVGLGAENVPPGYGPILRNLSARYGHAISA